MSSNTQGDAFTNAVGWFVNGITGKTGQMDFNSAEAEKQRNWDEHMSNTQHQREILDMQAAGINPALTAMGGSGAGTPNAATANSPGGGGLNLGGILSGIASIINSASTLASGNAETKAKYYSNTNNLMNTAVKLVATGLGWKG